MSQWRWQLWRFAWTSWGDVAVGPVGCGYDLYVRIIFGLWWRVA
jgi:hypothetical protein